MINGYGSGRRDSAGSLTFNIPKEGFMNAKKGIMLIGSVALAILFLVGGAWVITAPPENVEAWKEKQCNEYVEQLEMLNRYKLFWSFVQRRVAFNDCLKKVDESGQKP
jgi:hypothetical protein